MTRTQPTARQLLILADRAERGQLSADEAARLRAGIRGLAAERDAATAERLRIAHRADVANHTRRRHSRQLAAVRALVRTARQRGARSIPVWALGHILASARPVSATGPEVTRRFSN